MCWLRSASICQQVGLCVCEVVRWVFSVPVARGYMAFFHPTSCPSQVYLLLPAEWDCAYCGT